MQTAYRPQHDEITDDMWKGVERVISANKEIPGSIITVLRECQDIVGYLPVALMDYIALGMGVAPSEVYGVASFYALFSMEPKGRHTIKMCLGTACYVKGIKDTMTRISNEFQVEEGGTSEDRRFSLEAVRCLGACGLAPVMVVDGNTHGAISSDKVLEILNKYT